MKSSDGISLIHPLNFAHLCFLFLFLHSCHPSSKPSTDLVLLPENSGEAISFLGDTLTRPGIAVDDFLHSDSLLREAFLIYEEDSTDLEATIWYGRRLAYMYRYKDAIRVFTRGMKAHPDVPELFRHRGHRFITIRQPDLAIQDLEYAASLSSKRQIEVEPDGIPNKLDIPLSNLHYNIYYHLGLAYYLKADYTKAFSTLKTSMQYAVNADLVVAASYWLYLAYLKNGDQASADELPGQISQDMEIIENETYLEQLLVFGGKEIPVAWTDSLLSPQSLANLYGMSCWYHAKGRAADAAAWRRRILSTGLWNSFGYIAAEADSARLLKK